MDMSRAVLVNENGHGGGSTSWTMQDAGFDEGVSQHRPNRVQTVVHHPSSNAPNVYGGRPDVSTSAGSHRCVEHIVCRFNNMRANSVGEGARQGGAASEAELVDIDIEDDDEEEEVVVKEATPAGKRKQTSKGRGKGKATAKEGGTNGEGGESGGRANWNLNESLVLVRGKRDQDDYFANAGTNFARMKTKDRKWADIANMMDKEGVRQDGDQCMKRWENIFGWYRKVWDREKESGLQSYFLMSSKIRREKGYKFNLDRTLYDAIHIMQGNNQAVHPPNIVDTGNRQAQQSQQGEHSQAASGGGEADTSASENKEADVGDGYGRKSSTNVMQGSRGSGRTPGNWHSRR
ncbi:hypothetical protein CBR_g23863 [Chara braunii]|uniref:Myb-like domain-containing protein n=1 Tax=Chara braunii TaxID=69332 RepID=A0A388L535_CHABU|nr:hypothetical protein CBR_g23863 [Chara braunii]|eukprot:GBG77414.1 hypothetical protein CBR_g23863 [Chara braunii]